MSLFSIITREEKVVLIDLISEEMERHLDSGYSAEDDYYKLLLRILNKIR